MNLSFDKYDPEEADMELGPQIDYAASPTIHKKNSDIRNEAVRQTGLGLHFGQMPTESDHLDSENDIGFMKDHTGVMMSKENVIDAYSDGKDAYGIVKALAD